MKKTFTFSLLFLAPLLIHAELITAVPGPSDQGGMAMPMISIINADDPDNPTTGEIAIDFHAESIPVLRSLEEFSPGNWFAEDAAWRNDLGSPENVGGTPAANAGNGDRFNNQYGFMFMVDPFGNSANIPSDRSLAIRLISFSSPEMRAFNYVNGQNLWDEIFETPDSQVLWNGSMWHNYFTLPADAPAGFYTATFEIFIADKPFSTGTGGADYTVAAQLAEKDPNFQSAQVDFTFRVDAPEGITFAAWLEQQLSEEELAQQERTDPEADPGNHNIPNLLRYAFGLDPRNPDSRNMPRPEMIIEDAENGAQLGIVFRRRSNALDLEYKIEATSDLQSWKSINAQTETTSTDQEQMVQVIGFENQKEKDFDRRFLRISVELHDVE